MPDQEAARATIDVDEWQLARWFSRSRSACARLQPERRSAADLVARMPVRHLGRARRDTLVPSWRARFFADTSRSPCMRMHSGFFASSSKISVFTTACSSTPRCSADARVPPRGSHVYRCGVNSTSMLAQHADRHRDRVVGCHAALPAYVPRSRRTGQPRSKMIFHSPDASRRQIEV